MSLPRPNPVVITIFLGFLLASISIAYHETKQTPEQKLAYLEARKEAFKECMQLAYANERISLVSEGGKSIVEACREYSYKVTYHLR